MKRRALIQAVPGGVLAALSAQWGVAQAQSAPNTLSLAFPFDVENWDPTSRIVPHATSLFKCVFDQPLDFAPDNSLQPGVVKHYEWIDKAGLALALDFRDDVFFHNGDKLTSADFKFTFLDRPRADRTVQLGYIWGGIDRIETPSPTRAIVHFKTPMVTAPQYLGFAGSFLLPKAYIEKVGYEAFLAKPVGTGPYKLVSYQRDSRIVLEAFDRYWGGAAKKGRVTIQIIKDPTARVSAVQSGQVALSYNLPVREVLRLGQLPTHSARLTPTVDTYLIHMLNSGATQDKNVRLAMHHAIDKAALSKALFNDVSKPLHTAAPPDTPSYQPDYVFPFSLDLARQALARSGYGPDKPVKFRFFATNGVHPLDYDMARAIVQMWKKVGIEAQLETIDMGKYFQLAAAGKLEGPVLWFWTNSSADPELYAGSYLNAATAFSVWRSADVTARLKPLLNELNYERRIQAYKEFNRWAVQEGYSLPLMQGVSTVAQLKTLTGYKPYQNGWILPGQWGA